jgi:hypothetical protein
MREELMDWLRLPHGRQPLLSGVSHDGTTTIGGFECWVTEPLSDEKGALSYLRPLAHLLGCVDAFSRRTWRARDQAQPGRSVRLLLFPPLAPAEEATGT